MNKAKVKRIARIESEAAPSPVERPSATKRLGDTINDFWTALSAEDLARVQGVQPIRKLGQIRTFSEPDEAEAEWFAREVRRWRNEGRPRAAVR